ncbi:MAG: nucleotide sugar dehydrogenase [Anaerolineales bacterium]|jgi:UDP-N-acetyl-D-glucosamine dehydrogenase
MSKSSNDLPASARDLVAKFKQRQGQIGVIGLGYVGLPLVMALTEAGFEVIGLDADPEKVAMLQAGKSYVEDVPSEAIDRTVKNGKLKPTTDYKDLSQVDGVSICVPTPLRKTGDPDLSYIVAVSKALVPVLHAGMVVILESTTYPGTTRELVQPELESTGLKVGEDIFLAFSPERVDPGRTDWTTVNTPKVIGGITPACTAVAAAMYGAAMENIVSVSSTEVAEMTKLLENTFRAVNIGLVNELALMCERLGIDTWEVIDAAASKPFGFMRFTPGPGLGGHCIPIDPLYLSWKLKSVKYNARFIELASEINTNMPRYVVGRVQDLLNTIGRSIRGAKILVLGAAYKPDVSDTRESPALDVIGLLEEKGAEVDYFDPFVEELQGDDWSKTSVPDLKKALKRADCVVLVTDHEQFDYPMIADTAALIFDTRNAFRSRGLDREHIARL